MCSKDESVCGGCCEEWEIDGSHFCAFRKVTAGVEGGVDSSAKINKASINTYRQGHLNDRMCL